MSINLMTSKDIREKFSRPVISFASDKSEKKIKLIKQNHVTTVGNLQLYYLYKDLSKLFISIQKS